MPFSLNDIILSTPPGGHITWVTFPFADGAAAVMKSLGGRWDKTAPAWTVPNDRMCDLRRRLPHIVELVRIQQALDAANGKTSRPVAAPFVRGAAMAVPSSAVGADWLKLGLTTSTRQIEVLRAAGCARKDGSWYAPADIAEQVQASLAAVRQAEDDEREMKKLAARAEAAHLAEAEASAIAVWGRRRYLPGDLDGLAEIAAAWPTALFVRIESRLLDGSGHPAATVTTAGGRTVSVGHLMRTETTQVSRRVAVVEMWACVFPEGSGFRTVVSTTSNGKTNTRTLANYAPPAVAP
jgi:hypothetical protein